MLPICVKTDEKLALPTLWSLEAESTYELFVKHIEAPVCEACSTKVEGGPG